MNDMNNEIFMGKFCFTDKRCSFTKKVIKYWKCSSCGNNIVYIDDIGNFICKKYFIIESSREVCFFIKDKNMYDDNFGERLNVLCERCFNLVKKESSTFCKSIDNNIGWCYCMKEKKSCHKPKKIAFIGNVRPKKRKVKR